MTGDQFRYFVAYLIISAIFITCVALIFPYWPLWAYIFVGVGSSIFARIVIRSFNR